MILGIVMAFFLGILGGGLLIYFYLNGSSNEEKIKEIEGLKKEQKEYREKVDSHFVETAELFKDLTDRYRDVYQHMATGADVLCSDEAKQLQADMSDSGLLIEAAQESEEVESEEQPSEELTAAGEESSEEQASDEPSSSAEEADVNIDDVLAEQHAAQTELENDTDPATVAEGTEADTEAESVEDDDAPTVVLADDDMPLGAEVEAPPEPTDENRRIH